MPVSERLFFALWPGDALREQLVQHRDLLISAPGGRLLPRENLHLTLAFLGQTDAGQRARVEAVAADLEISPFRLRLDRFGYWPRPKVLWIAPAQMPAALTDLAAALHAGAGSCGLRLDTRPYQAHVTLARQLPQPPSGGDCPALDWAVDRFVLVRSSTLSQGVRYDVVGEWGLGE